MNTYTLIKPEGGCGICGYIWQVLRAIYHNPDRNYYVDFDTCIYKDLNYTNTNVWDLYFEQPSPKINPVIDQIDQTVGIIHDAQSEFRDVFMVNPTPATIQEIRDKFNSIITRYTKLNPRMLNIVNTYIEKEFAGKQILGVHLRGTDHPDKQPIVHYMQHIKDIQYSFDKIFVATDEQSRFDTVKEIFGDKVICYNSIKSNSIASLHHVSTQQPGYQFKIAEDVIVESFLLANTQFLLCCPNSNVNYLSRAINSTLPCKSI